MYYYNDIYIHSDTPHSVGLLRTCDRTVADTHNRHSCPRQDSKPQSSTSERQQKHALGRADAEIGVESYYTLFLDPTAPGTENLQYDTIVIYINTGLLFCPRTQNLILLGWQQSVGG
jgi:hypothetical protein